MKRIIVVLLSLLTFFCLSACTAVSESNHEFLDQTQNTDLPATSLEKLTTETATGNEASTQEDIIPTTSTHISDISEQPETTVPSTTEYRRSHTAMDQILATQTFGSVYFGTYEQDMDFDSKDPIEWIVLKIENDRALLISKYVLDWKPLSTDEQCLTWDVCSLRGWLNTDFYYAAFSNEEKEEILITSLDNTPSHPDWGLWGDSTEDSVFLLNYQEAKEYFPSDNARCAYPTPYAVWMGASEFHYREYQGTTLWYLREPGTTDVYGVPKSFSVGTDFIQYHSYGVRPAIWINLVP